MAGGAVEEVVKPGRGFSLSLTGAGSMLKPLDCGEDEQDAEMMILIVGGGPTC